MLLQIFPDETIPFYYCVRKCTESVDKEQVFTGKESQCV